jgi:drug/metabolite transporter (DMT)-like permease
MKKQLSGVIALSGATVIWGSAFIAQSVGMDKIGPFTFQAVRCFLAVVFLFPASALFSKGKPFWKSWADPALWRSGVICGLALFAASSLQQIGLVYTDAGKAGFLTAMYIVFVPFLGLFLGQKPGRNALLSLIPAIVGLYLLSCTSVSGINKGDVLLLLCAVAFSVQILLIDRHCAGLDGLKLNCIQALVAAVLSVPWALLTETVDASRIASCWLPLGYAGILSMGVAYTLQIVGQKRVAPSAAALLMSLESVFAALFGWLLLHETMTRAELLGCLLVFAAVVMSQLPEKKE